MTPWIEIYDNEQVQWHLRQQVLNYGAAIVALISVAAFASVRAGYLPGSYQLAVAAVAVVTLCTASVVAARIRGLRTHAWCIKLSPHMIMGYDYRRQPTSFAWSEVDRINVSDDRISITTGHSDVIALPTMFPDFAYVSHRILDLAELHRVPVHIDGRSLADTDLFALLPELRVLCSFPVAPGAAT